MCACAVAVEARGGHRITWVWLRGCCLSVTAWVPGPELRSSVRAASTLNQSHLSSSRKQLKTGKISRVCIYVKSSQKCSILSDSVYTMLWKWRPGRLGERGVWLERSMQWLLVGVQGSHILTALVLVCWLLKHWQKASECTRVLASMCEYITILSKKVN